MDNLQGFQDLLLQLSKFMDDKSMSKPIKYDLTEAQQNLSEAKHYYYQQLILFTELKEILLDNNFGLNDQQYEEDKSEEPNVFRILSETMSRAEAKNCLNISMKGKPSPEEQLFGLTCEDFEVEPKMKKVLHQNIQQQCIPLMEKKLKNKCLVLYRFWNPSNKDSEGLALAKANQLAITIVNEKKKLEESKETLTKNKNEYDTLYNQFYSSISVSIEEVEEKLANVSHKPQLAGTKITSEWIAAKCDYILSKIRVMKNHIHAHTYSEETLQALEKVRSHLEREINRTQKELQRTKQALFTYESIGNTFKQLLTQYTQLTMEIDNKKWALSELNKDKD